MFGHRANPNGSAVGGEIGATCAGNSNLSHTREAGGGENLDAIHISVSHENMLASGIPGDVPVMRLTGGIIHGGHGIRSRVGGSRQIGSHSGLNGETETCRMRKRAAGALGADGGASCRCVWRGGKEDRGARADGDAERTCGARDDSGRQTREGHLDGASESIERVDGQIDRLARGALQHTDRILGKADREIGLRRRWRRRLNRVRAATTAAQCQRQKSK